MIKCKNCEARFQIITTDKNGEFHYCPFCNGSITDMNEERTIKFNVMNFINTDDLNGFVDDMLEEEASKDGAKSGVAREISYEFLSITKDGDVEVKIDFEREIQ